MDLASSLSLADPRSGSNTFVWFPHMHSKELQPFGLLGELWWSWQEASVLPAVTALGIVSEAFVALLGPTELMVFLFSLHLIVLDMTATEPGANWFRLASQQVPGSHWFLPVVL